MEIGLTWYFYVYDVQNLSQITTSLLWSKPAIEMVLPFQEKYYCLLEKSKWHKVRVLKKRCPILRESQ